MVKTSWSGFMLFWNENIAWAKAEQLYIDWIRQILLDILEVQQFVVKNEIGQYFISPVLSIICKYMSLSVFDESN